jgi:hypothetical protein
LLSATARLRLACPSPCFPPRTDTRFPISTRVLISSLARGS